MLYRVEVYSADMLVDLQTFLDERQAEMFAGEMQDSGFKVRLYSF